MKTDHLDLVQFHRSLTMQQYHEAGALDELVKLRDEGKVRFLGVSAVLPTFDEQIDTGVFDAFQVPYSAVQREQEDAIARASAAGAGIIIRGGVARGVPEEWSANRRNYMVATETMRDYWEQAKLEDLLDGASRMEFLLRFTLSNPDLDTTIVGTRSVEHLRDNLAVATKGPLPHDVLNEAKSRLTAAGAKPA
jgi:aryl-alcohol dehydrogenase-like predicted oxidoreductase